MKLPELTDWILTSPFCEPLVALAQTDYSLSSFCWVLSCCIPTSCDPRLSNHEWTQALCCSNPWLQVCYQTLLCWLRLRSSVCFLTWDMQRTWPSTICTFLGPSSTHICVLWPVRQQEGSIRPWGANSVHCLFTLHQQHCTTGCGSHAVPVLTSLCPGPRSTALCFAQQPRFKGTEEHGLAPSLTSRQLRSSLFYRPSFPGKHFNN